MEEDSVAGILPSLETTQILKNGIETALSGGSQCRGLSVIMHTTASFAATHQRAILLAYR